MPYWYFKVDKLRKFSVMRGEVEDRLIKLKYYSFLSFDQSASIQRQLFIVFSPRLDSLVTALEIIFFFVLQDDFIIRFLFKNKYTCTEDCNTLRFFFLCDSLMAGSSAVPGLLGHSLWGSFQISLSASPGHVTEPWPRQVRSCEYSFGTHF